jgi:hypothetical protein
LKFSSPELHVTRHGLVAFAVVVLVAPLVSRTHAGQAGGFIAVPSQAIPEVQSRDAGQVRTQQVPIGTGVISGTVTAADSGRPLSNVVVSLSGTAPVAATAARGAGPARGGVANDAAPMASGTPAGQSLMFSMNRTAVTDARGRFSFEMLPAGRFTLNASRQQFVTASYGQKKPGRPGTPIQLADGQQMTATLRMTRLSVITGVLTGEDGEPVLYGNVSAMRYDTSNGFRRLQNSGGAQTDDRGVYRIFNLQPGDYFLAATGNSSMLTQVERAQADRAALEAAVAAATRGGGPNRPSTVPVPIVQANTDGPAGYAPTYFPGTPMLASASTVRVGPGEERTGIDIQVQAVRAGHIRGTVDVPPGLKAAVQISLSNSDPAMAGLPMQNTRANPDGTFILRSVAPGNYTVMAQTVPAPVPVAPTGPPPAPPRLAEADRLWGRAPVFVDGQGTATVSLQLEPGRSISGQVIFDVARAVDLTRTQVMVTISPAPSAEQSMTFGPVPQAVVGPDGQFSLGGILPGRYLLRTSYASAKSVIVRGEDVLDFPLEITGREDIVGAVITVSDKVTEISGRLTEANGRAGADYTILVAPDDPRYWTPGSRRVMTTRPGTDGQFAFRSLPAGSYYLAAVGDVEPGGQYDPEFLRSIVGASVRVTLADGGKVMQDIRVAGR